MTEQQHRSYSIYQYETTTPNTFIGRFKRNNNICFCENILLLIHTELHHVFSECQHLTENYYTLTQHYSALSEWYQMLTQTFMYITLENLYHAGRAVSCWQTYVMEAECQHHTFHSDRMISPRIYITIRPAKFASLICVTSLLVLKKLPHFPYRANFKILHLHDILCFSYIL